MPFTHGSSPGVATGAPGFRIADRHTMQLEPADLSRHMRVANSTDECDNLTDLAGSMYRVPFSDAEIESRVLGPAN
jgi:hypothetical protein